MINLHHFKMMKDGYSSLSRYLLEVIDLVEVAETHSSRRYILLKEIIKHLHENGFKDRILDGKDDEIKVLYTIEGKPAKITRFILDEKQLKLK